MNERDPHLGDTSRFGGRTDGSDDGDDLVVLSITCEISFDLVRPSFIVIIMQTPQDVMILFIAHDHVVITIALAVILFVFVAIDGR